MVGEDFGKKMVGEDKHGSLWNNKKRIEFTYHLGGMDNLESP
jgi:hypothetical protein